MRYIATFTVPFGRPFNVALQARSAREARAIAGALGNGPRDASGAMRAAFEVANEALFRNLRATRYPRRDPATWTLVHVAKDSDGAVNWSRAARLMRRGVDAETAVGVARMMRDQSSDYLAGRAAGARVPGFRLAAYGQSGSYPMLSGQHYSGATRRLAYTARAAYRPASCAAYTPAFAA